MRVKMLKTANGSEDGFTAKTYAEGVIDEVGPALARSFIDGGLAVEAEEAPAPKGRRK